MSNEGPRNATTRDGYFICPAADGHVHPESHQADPCRYCNTVFHDRCFHTLKHRCVQKGLISEIIGYGVKPSPGEPPLWVSYPVPEEKP